MLAEDPWALDFVEWWLWSVEWDGMTGEPRKGAPRWPFRGGVLRQPRRLIEACALLRAEWPKLERRPVEGGGN
jgi:hypothetical protein